MLRVGYPNPNPNPAPNPNSHPNPNPNQDTTRILAVSMWWSGIFPVQIPCACIYYLMAVFVARSNLLGRVEPG